MKHFNSRFFSAILLSLFIIKGQSQTISTIAGIGNGDGYQATSVGIGECSAAVSITLATDKKGNLYFSTGLDIRKIDKNGVLSTIAGSDNFNGLYGGDGGPAILAIFGYIRDIASDSIGNIYVVDQANNCIRKIGTNGIVNTIAGIPSSTGGFSGDGGLATKAQLNNPLWVALDVTGNVYIADNGNSRIREVKANGIITTVAGGGSDTLAIGNLATSAALLNYATSVAVDSKGNLYFPYNNLNYTGGIYKVAPNGVVLESFTQNFGGDWSKGGYNLNVDASNNIYITYNTYKGNIGIPTFIDKIDSNGVLTTIATQDSSLQLQTPFSNVAFDSIGNVYVPTLDSTNTIPGIVKLNSNGKIVNIIAGNGTNSHYGDSVLATKAQFSPSSIVNDAKGNIYIADLENRLIRKINNNGTITTIAGNGIFGNSAFTGLAINAEFSSPQGIAIDKIGNLFICDYDNQVIQKIDNSGNISTIAGSGDDFYNGDSIPADLASLSLPSGVAVDTFGNVFIADTYHNRIRKVDTKGIITTIAGNGTPGYSGDGGLGGNAMINQPVCIATDNNGNVYFSDSSSTIRRIDTKGIITTVAGNGIVGYSGDGGKARGASLNYPNGITIAANGTMFIADTYNNVIRKVGTDSIVTTVVGNGIWGFSGDGSNATAAKLNYPRSLAIDNAGNLLVADYYNLRIRKVTPAPLPLVLVAFSATAEANKTVVTNWQTATELNTSHFIIQRSTDGTSFTEIGKVKAIGSGANSYTFTDDKPTNSINYYRLQSVDKDGSSSYSKVVSVNFGDKQSFSIIPNPARDFATISFNKTVDKATIAVYDITGKQVIMQSLSGIINSYKLNTQSLKSGLFVIKVNTATGSYNEKLLINK